MSPFLPFRNAVFHSIRLEISPGSCCCFACRFVDSVIHAYANAGLPNKAEAIIRLMIEDYENGNDDAEPNVRVFNNVLHTWRKSKDHNAPERCEAILREMQHLCDSGKFKACQPDTYAVTVLLHAWLESSRNEKTKRAELIFRQMQRRYEQGNEMMRPDRIAYSLVLNGYAEERNHEKAEEMLWEMVTDFLSGNDSAEPRTRNFQHSHGVVFKIRHRGRAFSCRERHAALSKARKFGCTSIFHQTRRLHVCAVVEVLGEFQKQGRRRQSGLVAVLDA